MVSENHDLQVRFRWRQPNDIGEWCLHCMSRYCLADRLRPSEATVVCSTPPRLTMKATGIGMAFELLGLERDTMWMQPVGCDPS